MVLDLWKHDHHDVGMKRSIDRRRVARLAAAHLVNDVNQSAVFGILPFLVADRGLGYAAAAGLVTASQVSSAVVQPLLGHHADVRASRLAMPLALVTGAVAVVSIGLVGTGPATAAVFIAGVATAAFHPESTRAVRGVGGGGASTALGIYALGGNLGTAVGPVVAAALVGTLGWGGPSVLIAVAALAAWLVVDSSRPGAAPAPAALGAAHEAPRWAAFASLVVVLALRAGFSACVTTFVPLYLVRMGGVAPATAGLVLTLTLLAGVAGALVAGRLADRFGARTVLIWVLAPLGPLLAAFTALHGAAAVACILCVGAGNIAPYAVAVVAAQDCLKGREGLAAGIAMGVGTALGSLMLPVVGYIAEGESLRTALLIAAALPVGAAVLAARR